MRVCNEASTHNREVKYETYDHYSSFRIYRPSDSLRRWRLWGRGSGGTPAEGLDLSGTWRYAGVECYDSSFQNITAAGTPTASSSVGTISIQRNQLISENLGTGSCKVITKKKIVANIKQGNASGGYGTGTFRATSVSTSPTSSCSLYLSFNMIQGAISPSTMNTNYTQAETTIPQQAFEFLINPFYLAITSLIQVVGRPTDVCLLIYQKL